MEFFDSSCQTCAKRHSSTGNQKRPVIFRGAASQWCGSWDWGWWKPGFSPRQKNGEAQFLSIGLYRTYLETRFFCKSFWYSKMVYLQPIDSCQRGIESMPPRKAIDWTNDDDLIRRLEHGGVHWPWRISRGFLKANGDSNWGFLDLSWFIIQNWIDDQRWT